MKNCLMFSDINELLTLKPALAQKARGSLGETSLGLKKNVCMVSTNGVVEWVGKKHKIPKDLRKKIHKEIMVKNNVMPGFIDPHTHSLFAGDRRKEFEMRNRGVSYEDIAKAGGGIQSTVRSTRKATKAQLQENLTHHLAKFLEQGVTTVEVKTGYGLSPKQEIKLLEVLKSYTGPVRVTSTFLGAHGASPECHDLEEYLEQLMEMLPLIAKKKLADRVDIFIERGYFNTTQGRRYLGLALSLGLDVTVHADQLSRSGATRLGVKLGAKSVDHAVHLTDRDILLLAASETTAVLLPNADFYIHESYPKAREMIDRGVRVALATDFNPGSAPTQNIHFLGLMARLQMGMSLPEVICAMTLGSSFALGTEKSLGALVPGYSSDFSILDCSWDELFYDLGSPTVESVFIGGKKVFKK